MDMNNCMRRKERIQLRPPSPLNVPAPAARLHWIGPTFGGEPPAAVVDSFYSPPGADDDSAERREQTQATPNAPATPLRSNYSHSNAAQLYGASACTTYTAKYCTLAGGTIASRLY